MKSFGGSKVWLDLEDDGSIPPYYQGTVFIKASRISDLVDPISQNDPPHRFSSEGTDVISSGKTNQTIIKPIPKLPPKPTQSVNLLDMGGDASINKGLSNLNKSAVSDEGLLKFDDFDTSPIQSTGYLLIVQ